MKHHTKDSKCLEFIDLTAKNGHTNKRFVKEWYRSLRKSERDTTANEDLLVKFKK